MALVLGTNCGFVASAPVDDPGETALVFDGVSYVIRDTSPANAVSISEIGWWRDSGTDTANFEVALYASDGSYTPGEAGTRLYVDDTNSSSSSGWISVSVDWEITGGTIYWLGAQLDAHSGSSYIDRVLSGGSGIDLQAPATTLGNPYGGGAIYDSDGMVSIYAVYTTSGAATTNKNLLTLGVA